MDTNQNYKILQAVMLENGRGFALGENPSAPDPYVTWACYDDQETGRREYEWGRYFTDRSEAEVNFDKRVSEYRRLYEVAVDHTEAPGSYKYYSTQRPVDLGTFPKPPHNAPDEIVNYEGRQWVEYDTRLAWGHLTYTRPLTEKEMSDYELKPSRDNPDLRLVMAEQATTVGKWETSHRVPEVKRLTFYYSDVGIFIAKNFVSPEKLAEAAKNIELKKELAAEKRRARAKPAPIAEQVKEAQKQIQEGRGQAAPGKDTPDKGGDR